MCANITRLRFKDEIASSALGLLAMTSEKQGHDEEIRL